jgi:hypothetical protein
MKITMKAMKKMKMMKMKMKMKMKKMNNVMSNKNGIWIKAI